MTWHRFPLLWKRARRITRVVSAASIALIAVMWTVDAIHTSAARDSSESAPYRFVAGGGQGADYPNCRFGVGGGVGNFDVAALNVGWHMDWSARISPTHPNGAEFVQMVQLMPDAGGYTFSPPTATLQAIMDANPGAIWLIGNEPDSPFGDQLVAEEYAHAYYQLYNLIKQHDPSARIGAGSIVQPTPLRFEYLERFLATYQQSYGGLPPVDLWSIHSYILREIDASDPEAYPHGPYEVWGAYIPPGLAATRGVLYTYSDMFDTALFQQRLVDFRTWMRDWGYRDTPLYLTEYGELFPYPPDIAPPPYQDEHGVYITEQRVAQFMTSTFDILLNLIDLDIGYPADANRLVQRWLWYSVSDTSFGGSLFDPVTHTRRPLGDVFFSYTHAISPGVDLLAVRVIADPPAVSATGQLQTTTLRATVSNIGNVSVTYPITVAFYAGWPPSGTLIGIQTVTIGLQGCAESIAISQTWPNLGEGAHPMYVDVNPTLALSETSYTNNQAAGVFLVAEHSSFLPIIHR